MNILTKVTTLLSQLFSPLKIAIDFGSSFCRIGIFQKGIVLQEANYIALNSKNGSFIFFGDEAKAIVGKAPEYIQIIRPVVAGIISDFDAAVSLMTYFLEKSVFPFLSKNHLIKPQLFAYVAIPSSCSEVEQRAIEEVFLKSGFSQVFLIERPIAGGIGAGEHIFSHQPTLIVDLGGGLVEISVISLGGIVVQKTLKQAGEHLDHLINNYLHLKYGVIVGNLSAENLKISLFSFEENNKSQIIRGKSLETRLPKSVRIRSQDIKEALSGYFNQIIDLIKEVLEASPPEVIDEIGKKGIILTGGLANIPKIDEFFSSDLKLPVTIASFPEKTVIRGLLTLIGKERWLKKVVIK